MAQVQVKVPYVDNYDFGIGADLATGSPMGKVVIGEISGVNQAEGDQAGFKISRITSTADLEKTLGIDVEASGGCGCFGGSARMSYARSSKIQSDSLFMAITASIELDNLSIDDPTLSPAALELAERPDVFEQRFGNMFVRGIRRGGLFIAVMQIDTGSAEESEAISAELSGSYGVFSAEAEMKMATVQETHHSELSISLYHEGGPINLSMDKDKLQDGNELYVMLQQWLTSFQDEPEKNSLPYTVTLAPIAIANGPIPPNAAEIQHAQDVLVICAQQRSRILDDLNLMDYIAHNAARYDFPEPTTPADIVKAFNGCQSDLKLVADTAAFAINHVSDAMPPADFAAKERKVYPQGVAPAPMPTLTKGPTDALAAKGEIVTNQDPLAVALRDQQPAGEGRRGFFIGMAVAERQTAPGPGKDRLRDGLPEAERGGFNTAVQFSLARNRAVEWAQKGAAVNQADPAVAAAARANASIFYCLGFDVGTGLYGDPALGADGNTATGPGALAIRDALGDPDSVRGFNSAVKFHLGPPLRART